MRSAHPLLVDVLPPSPPPPRAFVPASLPLSRRRAVQPRAMAARKRAAAALDQGHATQGSATCCNCKKRRMRIGSTADYEDTSRLGEGGFGVVLKARHRVTGKTVAIKSLFPPDDFEEEPADVVGELLREARFLEACSGNPYVVGFHDLLRDPTTGDLCLAMEYAGPNLYAFLRERRGSSPLPESMVRALMWKLLTGAKKMHELHIVHRDIKPDNVLVGEGGELVKICDLGLAMSLTEPTPYGQAGSVSYMAPEMLLGKTDYDARVDAWSLGCVMAAIITGKTPFQGNNEDETLQLWAIFNVLGMPDDSTWPEFTSLPLAGAVPRLLPKKQRKSLREMVPEEMLSKDGFEVLEGLLVCDPDKRLTAAAALKLPWFAAPRPAAAAKIGELAFPRKEVAAELPKKKAFRVKIIPPATPKKKNVLTIPLAIWNAQRV